MDSDTLRSLAPVTGRGVGGSVVPGIVVLAVVTGYTVVRGVTWVVVVFVVGGGTGESGQRRHHRLGTHAAWRD